MNTFRMVYLAMIAVALFASQAATSRAQLTPTTVTANGPDDSNTSTLNPSPIIPVGGGTAVPQCPWINTGLADSGFVGSNGWNFTWAPSAAFIQPDLTITSYYAWAVNSPVNVPNPDGSINNRNVVGQDAGGALFIMTYTPKPGDPTNSATSSLHWVQGYEESFNGGPFTFHLDQPTNSSPFYDVGGAAGMGTLPNNASWFRDTPYDYEAAQYPGSGLPGGEESLTNSVVQFQVVLASDTVSNGAHNVTLWGGDWWGYQYSNFDVVPEPSSLALLSMGVLALMGMRRRVRR